MSIAYLESVFMKIKEGGSWSLLLFRIDKPQDNHETYACRQITLEPSGELNKIVGKIVEQYLKDDKWSPSKGTDVREYDGTTDALTIYRIQIDNPLIAEDYNALLTQIGKPQQEADSEFFNSGTIIKGNVTIDEKETKIILVSVQKPFSPLRHKNNQKYKSTDRGTYAKLRLPVLTLQTKLDIIVVDKTVYFLGLNGEKLFNMERAYKKVCETSVKMVVESGLISGTDEFANIARSGHNPRRFMSFNENRLNALKNDETRKKMAKKFHIPLNDEAIFDATKPGAADAIVKLLCNKGMVDPFNNDPVEVLGSKGWKGAE